MAKLIFVVVIASVVGYAGVSAASAAQNIAQSHNAALVAAAE